MMDLRPYMWVLWDLLAVGILFYFVGNAAAKGMVRTLISFLGYVVAAAVAKLATPVLAEKLYELVVRDALRLVVMNRLEGIATQGGELASGLLDAIPQGLRRLIPVDALDTVEKAAGSDAGQLVGEIIDAALRDPVISILGGLLFLLVFTLVLLVVRQVSRLFTGMYRIPLIGTVNTLLGGLVGVVEAALVLFLSALVLHLLITFTGGGYFWLNEKIMDDSYICRVFFRMTSF